MTTPSSLTQDELKTLVGQAALQYVVPGEVVGVTLGEAGEMAAGVLAWLQAASRGAAPGREPLDQASAWLSRQQTLYGDLVSPVSADRMAARTALADAEGRAAFLERTLEETRTVVEKLEGLVPLSEDLRRQVRSLEAQLTASQAAVREAALRLETLVEPG